MFCQDFIYVKFDFPLCQPSVFPLPCKNGIVSSFWFAFLAVEYLWRAFNHSSCELFHSRGCQIIGNPEHTQKPAQPSVKFQSEASSCYMSNCEKENFWPTFDCQAVCRMTLCSLRYRYKHKGETQRNTVVYLELIEWEHRSYKCFRFHFRPRLTSELKFNFLNAKKRNNKCRKGGTTIWVSCFIIEQRFCSCIRRPVSTYKHICYFSRTITDDFEKQPQEYWSGVHSKICNRGASVRSYPIYMIT